MSLPNPVGSLSDQCLEENPCGKVVWTWKGIICTKEGEFDQRNSPSLKSPLDADEDLNYQKKICVVFQDEEEADYGMEKAVSQPHQAQ